jgi:CBS domain-containing protein
VQTKGNFKMTQIKDCMTQNCHWVTPETTIQEAAQQMKDEEIGFLPVGENDRLTGMVTDRDIVTRAVANNWKSSTEIRDVMTPQTYYCYANQPAEEVCANMADLQIRRMPVVDENKRLIGTVSMGDLAQNLDSDMVGEAEQQITWQLHSKHQKAA